MYYFDWTIGDDFHAFEVIGQKGEPDSSVRQRAAAKYKEIAATPGVSNIETYIQTIDVKFSSGKDAKEYTYFCDVDQVTFAKMCARNSIVDITFIMKNLVRPKRWDGAYYPDENGNPKGFYFIRAKYRSAADLTKAAKVICERRGIEYTGNLLQVYTVFHA